MKIVKYIPDSITSMNLLSGTIGVVFAMKGRLDMAFVLMLCAAVFDFCDGLCARLLHAYSDIGKELDSLSDVVSFGVLPAVMLYRLGYDYDAYAEWLFFVPMLIAVFSGIRLARFNVDDRQHSSFIGLPSPASAMICGSLAFHVAMNPGSPVALMCYSPFFIPAVSLVLCFLLVCNLPMFSLKFSREDSKALVSKRIAFAVCCILCLVFVLAAGLDWSVVILLSLVSYVCLNAVFALLEV